MNLPSPRAEERIVLESIYTPEELSISDDYTVQFQLGTAGTLESFVVTVKWPVGYPFTAPEVNLDSFGNRHVPAAMKLRLIEELTTIAEANNGEPLTFTLIEHLRDNFEVYAQELRDSMAIKVAARDAIVDDDENDLTMGKEKLAKKMALTKSQKRRQFNRMDEHGQMPRGWNWIDVVKHLRQTGGQQVEE